LIRDIVFDVGKVFVDLNPRPILSFLSEHRVPCADLDTLITSIALEEHECGRVGGAGLLERLCNLTNLRASAEHMRAKWLDMFELQPAMVALARRLSERYGVYLLSNVGDLHWEHLCREYGLDRIGHGALPSFEAGVTKPHERIYAEAERKFALRPAATVFVDDRTANVEAARKRGWHGVVHRSYAQTCAALRRLGVEAGPV
jgi:HAD superfamily hydrolase (TIGR01509 family)